MGQVVWYEDRPQSEAISWKTHPIDLGATSPLHGNPVDMDGDGDLDVVMTMGFGYQTDHPGAGTVLSQPPTKTTASIG